MNALNAVVRIISMPAIFGCFGGILENQSKLVYLHAGLHTVSLAAKHRELCRRCVVPTFGPIIGNARFEKTVPQPIRCMC